MSYLNREQRRESILDAAKKIALSEGLAAMTVRKIANEAQISVGQIHHHFSSSSHLKAEVFLCLMQQLDKIANTMETQDSIEHLLLLLGCINLEYAQPYFRLWNEAEILAKHDAELNIAYNQAMQEWHQSIQLVIQQGQDQNIFKKDHPSEDIAWRLIAFVCGLDGIYKLGLQGLNEQDFTRHTQIIIKAELF